MPDTAIDWTRLQTRASHQAASLEADRTRALNDLAAWMEAATRQLTGPVPLDEKLAWGLKEAAARAYLDEACTPEQLALLSGEAQVTGEDPGDLALDILLNADSYRAAIAMLTGLRRKTALAIVTATDVEEMAAHLVALALPFTEG